MHSFLNLRKNKIGSLLCRLKNWKFVGNFRLFERSEFRKFPLSKFPIFQEIRQSRACFLFAYFCFARAKKK
ncbi:conserved hypothetical protein [Haemophilus influenzae NT127]|nr:conserved hypothetical protein [Haemophilus influenzae NT127]